MLVYYVVSQLQVALSVLWKRSPYFYAPCSTNQYVKVLPVRLMIKLGEKMRLLMVAQLGWLCNELWWQNPNVSTINTTFTMLSQFHPFCNHKTWWPNILKFTFLCVSSYSKCQLLKRFSDILYAFVSPIRATSWHLWFCYGNYAGIVQLRERMTGDEMWKNMEEWVMWSMCVVGYKNVFEVKYLWIVVTNQNYLHKEITNSLNLGIACQYTVHIALFSHVLFKNITI